MQGRDSNPGPTLRPAGALHTTPFFSLKNTGKTRFGGTKPLLISFLNYILYINIHSQHSLSSARVSLSLSARVEGLHWGAEPRFELGTILTASRRATHHSIFFIEKYRLK